MEFFMSRDFHICSVDCQVRLTSKSADWKHESRLSFECNCQTRSDKDISIHHLLASYFHSAEIIYQARSVKVWQPHLHTNCIENRISFLERRSKPKEKSARREKRKKNVSRRRPRGRT